MGDGRGRPLRRRAAAAAPVRQGYDSPGVRPGAQATSTSRRTPCRSRSRRPWPRKAAARATSPSPRCWTSRIAASSPCASCRAGSAASGRAGAGSRQARPRGPRGRGAHVAFAGSGDEVTMSKARARLARGARRFSNALNDDLEERGLSIGRDRRSAAGSPSSHRDVVSPPAWRDRRRSAHSAL